MGIAMTLMWSFAPSTGMLSLVQSTPRLWSGHGTGCIYAAMSVEDNIHETRFQAKADLWCANNIITDDQMFEKVYTWPWGLADVVSEEMFELARHRTVPLSAQRLDVCATEFLELSAPLVYRYNTNDWLDCSSSHPSETLDQTVRVRLDGAKSWCL
jgi:hypothetical protein